MDQVSSRIASRLMFRDLPLFILAVFTLVELAIPGFSKNAAGWPFLISLLVVGLPHGAVDFSVNNRLSGAGMFAKQIYYFLSYTLLIVASSLLFFLFPLTVLLMFAVLSAIHFGLADARSIGARGTLRQPLAVLAASTAARGLSLLALPFALYPSDTMAVVSSVLKVVGHPGLSFDSSTVTSVSVGLLILAACLHCMVTTWRLAMGEAYQATAEVLETTVIAFAFAALHPLFAVGLYFIAWHSWRHMDLLILFLTAEEEGKQSVLQRMVQVHAKSLPLLIPTLLLIAGFAWLRLDSWTAFNLAAVAIATFVVVTLPHHLLVEELVARTSGLLASTTPKSMDI